MLSLSERLHLHLQRLQLLTKKRNFILRKEVVNRIYDGLLLCNLLFNYIRHKSVINDIWYTNVDLLGHLFLHHASLFKYTLLLFYYQFGSKVKIENGEFGEKVGNLHDEAVRN